MRIATLEQLLDALDQVFDDGSDWTRDDGRAVWEDILSRPDHPLNSDLPDANLVQWRARAQLPAGEGRAALDVGCGLGRNARWLSRQGYRVTGLDLSPYAVTGAARRTTLPDVTFVQADFLRNHVPGEPYDVVYDSGCFHHLPPHRRLSYLRALAGALQPGGYFGICTFAPGRMGSEDDDVTVLRRGHLEGGTAYSVADLRAIFSDLEDVTGGPLEPASDGEDAVFAMDVLNAALFRRPA
ncbi:class I SAM-dependent methyltransferase [Deinococcus sp.]|uniref:class I SAM-dependent methyltransferase n=1 Tax=Deinococcus sp. TaxID=47478 RepID=UPI002869912E|nr:class I SAM-dependent methyltransferase [Deinococcus sp.]